MEQYAVVSFDTGYETVGQPFLPPSKERLSVCGLQLYLAFQPIEMDAV